MVEPRGRALDPNQLHQWKNFDPQLSQFGKDVERFGDFAGIKDNSKSFFGLWPYDIPGEDWIYKCGNDWCVDTTLTINCSMFNNTEE